MRLKSTWFGHPAWQLVGLTINIAIFVCLLALLEPLIDGWAILASFLVMFFAADYTDSIINTFSAKEYIKTQLGLVLTFSEASYIASYFTPNDKSVWYPLEYIKDLPEHAKKEALISAIRNIDRQQQ